MEWVSALCFCFCFCFCFCSFSFLLLLFSFLLSFLFVSSSFFRGGDGSLVSCASLSLSLESPSRGALRFVSFSAAGSALRDNGEALVGRCVRLSPQLQRYGARVQPALKINAFELRDGVAWYKVALASAVASVNVHEHWIEANQLIGATFAKSGGGNGHGRVRSYGYISCVENPAYRYISCASCSQLM